jgi:hypothetical protein
MILPEEGVDRLGWFVSRRGHENRSNGGPIWCRTIASLDRGKGELGAKSDSTFSGGKRIART